MSPSSAVISPSPADRDVQVASLSARTVAAVIDYVVLVGVSYTALPLVLRLVPLRGTACLAFQVLLLASYFAILWTAGGTLGMRAVHLRMVARRGGRAEFFGRSVARTVLTFPSGGAAAALALIAWVALIGETPTGANRLPGIERVLVLLGIASVWLAGSLWMLTGQGREPLHDRITGLRVYDDSPARPRPSTAVGTKESRIHTRQMLPLWIRAACWFGAVALLPVALAFVAAGVDMAAERNFGGMAFSFYITGGAAIGAWQLGRLGRKNPN